MESDHKHYSRHGMREGDPGDVNPNEIQHSNPANSVSENKHLDVNQSQSGRDDSYKAAEEHIGTGLSDFDNMEHTTENEPDGDERGIDERDNHDSSEDWDAEKNRSGRNK